MAPTYGLVEQAALIIKSQWFGTPSPASQDTALANPATRSATETTAQSTATTSSKKNGASNAGAPCTLFSLASAVVAAWSLM